MLQSWPMIPLYYIHLFQLQQKPCIWIYRKRINEPKKDLLTGNLLNKQTFKKKWGLLLLMYSKRWWARFITLPCFFTTACRSAPFLSRCFKNIKRTQEKNWVISNFLSIQPPCQAREKSQETWPEAWCTEGVVTMEESRPITSSRKWTILALKCHICFTTYLDEMHLWIEIDGCKSRIIMKETPANLPW